jgi:hypothetical protein
VLDLNFLGAAAGTALGGLHFQELALRFACAIGASVLIAARPWRLALGRRLPRPEMVQAQILLCAAAALITVVIGDSVAKAFGLVGLGSFVRFRSGLKDPRDAAVLFLVIGLGMACGHGSVGVALAGAVLGSALLAVLDLFQVPDLPREEADGAADPRPATAPTAPAIAGVDVGKRP